MSNPDKVRIDKWLHAVRVFKTRSLATDACNAGKVKIDDARVKPSRQLAGGETIHVRKGALNMTVRVKGLIEKRVSAKISDKYVENMTPDEEYIRVKAAFQYPTAPRSRGSGRPTKKERRQMEKLRKIL